MFTLRATRQEDIQMVMWPSTAGPAPAENLISQKKALIKKEITIRSTDGLTKLAALMKQTTGTMIRQEILINATGGLITRARLTKQSTSPRRMGQSHLNISPRIKMEKSRNLKISITKRKRRRSQTLRKRKSHTHSLFLLSLVEPLFILPIAQLLPSRILALINDTYILWLLHLFSLIRYFSVESKFYSFY